MELTFADWKAGLSRNPPEDRDKISVPFASRQPEFPPNGLVHVIWKRAFVGPKRSNRSFTNVCNRIYQGLVI